MEWTDDAIVLSLRGHGESSGILETLTAAHGRHLGLVHGATSPKRRAMLQPGNRVSLTWRARISENLGVFVVELARERAHALFEHRASLTGVSAFAAVANAVLPEREPHRPAFEGGEVLLEAIAEHGFADWIPLYVRWEAGLLEELGFGLDFRTCAATGTTENLIYVSPRSGRAVSMEPGEAYRDRLLALPPFLLGRQDAAPTPEDLFAGLKLTAHFLDHFVLAPHSKSIPEARQRLSDLAARNANESL